MQQDATHRTAIITGGNIGLGFATAQALLAQRAGWHVVIASRDMGRAAAAVRNLRETANDHTVEAMPLDLASLASVRAFASAFSARDLPPLHLLICNAGIQITSGITYTEDGYETTFGVNFLGHYLLVNLLLPRLVAPARVVWLGSGTHDPDQRTGMPKPRYTNADLLAHPDNDPNNAIDSPSVAGRRRYAVSKLCDIYGGYELARRLDTAGLHTPEHPITSNIYDPGLMPGSGLARDYPPILRFIWHTIFPLLRILPGVTSTRASGKILARLATEPQYAQITGKYFSLGKEAKTSDESYDRVKAAKLWDDSARLVHLTPSETLLPFETPAPV